MAAQLGVSVATVRRMERRGLLHPEPIGVDAVALDERGVEELLVPADDRASARYRGYGLVLSVAQLNREFELVGAAGAPVG